MDDYQLDEQAWLDALEANPDNYEFMGNFEGQMDYRDTQRTALPNRGFGQSIQAGKSTSLSTVSSNTSREFTFGLNKTVS